jgi:hypothetical protein
LALIFIIYKQNEDSIATEEKFDKIVKELNLYNDAIEYVEEKDRFIDLGMKIVNIINE